MRISDWSSDVCSSDLARPSRDPRKAATVGAWTPAHSRTAFLPTWVGDGGMQPPSTPPIRPPRKRRVTKYASPSPQSPQAPYPRAPGMRARVPVVRGVLRYDEGGVGQEWVIT